MFKDFDSIKGFLKLDAVKIDNNVFRLHYKCTMIVLMILSVALTAKNFSGEPIHCIVDEIRASVMNNYCWIYSTYTVPSRLDGRVGKDVVQPGVSNFAENEDEVHYHKYYQWVCFVLFFQAILFYIPRFIWKNWEGGRIRDLVTGLDKPFVTEEDKNNRLNALISYFMAYKQRPEPYAYFFYFCEILNLINVIGQIFFIDFFLDGEFSTYGLDVINFTYMDPEVRQDPMARVFPKLTKCTFRKYGPSGNIQPFDGLCVLPLNILNEKIYVFLWFWFIILSVITAVFMIYRTALLYSKALRVKTLCCSADTERKEDITIIVEKHGISSWFVLLLISESMDPQLYDALLKGLASKTMG